MATMKFTIKAYDSISGNTVRSDTECDDYDDAAHAASEIYKNIPGVESWTVIVMGPLGSKRADMLEGWYPSLWQLKQDLKKKLAEKNKKK